MRRGSNPDILMHGETFIGFDLSSDFCAEHEWGTKFTEVFGLGDSKKYGMARRKITKLPVATEDSWTTPRVVEHFTVRSSSKKSFLVFDYPRNIEHIKTEKRGYELDVTKWSKNNIGSAWDDSSFGIVTDKYHAELAELYEAFQKKDIVIGLFGRGVFQNAGLKILIASRLPKEITDPWLVADKDAEALAKASDKTKIKNKLEKAGKKYFALTPKWSKELISTAHGEIKTKYDVLYWLNPQDQKNNSYGWFTVEELLLWAENKGPVIDRMKK